MMHLEAVEGQAPVFRPNHQSQAQAQAQAQEW